MNLIGRNKIAAHIFENPEHRVALLTFLREFPYRPHRYGGIDGDYLNTTMHVNGIDCLIKALENNNAKAIFITQLSSSENERRHVDVEVQTKTVTVTVQAPPPRSFEEVKQMKEEERKLNTEIFIRELNNPGLNTGAFYSPAEYEQSLNRVDEIFDTKPGTIEYEELLNLLPELFRYEEYKLEFPKLKIFEVVKHRMDLFSMTDLDLQQIVVKEELDSFLSGDLVLADETLIQLFDILALRAPLADKRFL